MTLNEYFDKILVVHLNRRVDRMEHCQWELKRYGLEVEFLEAYDNVRYTFDDVRGKNSHAGCTNSHRLALDLIHHFKWKRTLILEDDFMGLYPDLQQRFSDMIGEVPDDWRMLYLGGHYGEKPKRRVTPHVIEMNGMLTTSSYGVTLDWVNEAAPYIGGVGPIDCQYRQWHVLGRCYIFAPRLFAQYASYSDIAGGEMYWEACMTDTKHEEMV
jgi:hypothetical protein